MSDATPASDAQIEFWKNRLAAELAKWHASPRGNRWEPVYDKLRNDQFEGLIRMLIARIEAPDYQEDRETTRKAYHLDEVPLS